MPNAGEYGICSYCGRVLERPSRCPNCGRTSPLLNRTSTADGYSVSSETALPRWLLLAGTILLLSGLVYVAAPRNPGRHNAVLAPTPAMTPVASLPTLPAPPTVSANAPTTAKPTPDPDEAFWRRKAERELREAEQYENVEKWQGVQDYYRTQDHFGLGDASRTTDYFTRRPESFGRR
jgi:hypothetical protein